MKKEKRRKGFKKHRFIKVLGGIVGIIFVFLAIVMFVGDEDYNEIETPTAGLVSELAEGGEPLVEGYDGEYGIWGVEQEQADLRDHYVDSESAENVTLMVYMIGSDLESEGGAATSDLQEMIDAQNGKNLNVVVQTGGAVEWQNEVTSAKSRERWLIQNGEISLAKKLPQASMCTKGSLEDFIKWSTYNYPADRYMLVLWDHGGGTMGGFGYDENYPDDTLTLSDMSKAIADSKVKLDMISFDACLMGTLEVGYSFEPFADYLLASEETEPGNGWDYTDTLAALSKKPSMSTVEFGARMIDDFGESYGNLDVTLSLMDLREVPALYESCSKYYAESLKLLQGTKGTFSQMSTARSKCRNYGEGECEQIDLIDYVQRTDVENAEEIIKSAFSVVKYRNDSNLSGSYGTAVYFPYTNPEDYKTVKKELDKVKYSATEGFYNEFLSILAGGNQGNANVAEQLTGYEESQQTQEEVQQEDWYESSASEDYDYQVIQDESQLALTKEDGQYVVSLSDEEWNSILDIQLQVMIDDGEGYIDLGSDQVFDWKDDDKLILDFNNIWTAIDGNLATYYACDVKEDGDNTTFLGKTQALLNGKEKIDIYIQTKQDGEENNKISVLGYIPTDAAGNTLPKGYLPLKKGDEIQLLCDYYTYDGEYDDSYFLGDPFVVKSQKALKVEDYDLEETGSVCSFQFTDLYQQNWYTEAMEFTYN